ncbi:PhnD/SsuA/transferrin family substrate-binding protein [Mesorhizobium sp. KR9-304]|uniref:phosphate/phosphite/phosphonate ABC transporter substrate-binding protein n=1 Tax=Mesorhizobium sp. KR9-304 TaxID=3156614 RepID=UPI0032B38168
MDIGNSEERRGSPILTMARVAGGVFCVAAACLTTTASADWREDIGTFRVGVVAEPGAGDTIAGLAELNDAFTKALGLKVEFFVARSYAALIDAQASSRIEYAIYSASAYASAYRRCECVEPLVAPTGEDGSIGIRSVLIAANGRLSSASDLAGRRIALQPPDSIAGHQLPLAAFQPGGKPLSGAESFFVKADSAEAAEAMLAEGSVDAIFGWMPAGLPDAEEIDGGTPARLAAAGMDRSALDIVWRSDVLRFGPHAVSIGLDPEPKRRLTEFLTGLRTADPEMYERIETHHLGGFTAASQPDYAVALDMVRMLGEARPEAQ